MYVCLLSTFLLPKAYFLFILTIIPTYCHSVVLSQCCFMYRCKHAHTEWSEQHGRRSQMSRRLLLSTG